jgi:hypothetical protein
VADKDFIVKNGLLVGKTSTSVADAGLVFNATNNYLGLTRASGAALFLNRNTDDGTIAEFRKDNAAVGSIGTQDGTLQIDGTTGSTGLLFGASNIYPRDNGANSDGGVDLGGSTIRWRDLFLSGGIQGAAAGSIVINEAGLDVDFRVESDTLTHALFVEGSSGNVGIGTTSPDTIIHVMHSTSPTLTLERNSTSLADSNVIGRISMAHKDSNDAGVAVQIIGRAEGTAGAAGLAFNTGTPTSIAERVRIDSSGNLLVSTTIVPGSLISTSTETGVGISTNGYIAAARASATAYFNRLTTDGVIVNFGKDGSTVGSIGTQGGDMQLGTGTIGLRFKDADSTIQPQNLVTSAGNDATIDLGTSVARFKDLYLSGGVYLGGVVAANLLEDYEEGTFDVTLLCNGISGTKTCQYTKIGNMVTVNFSDKASSSSYWGIFTGSTAGQAVTITSSLPFTPNSNGGFKISGSRSLSAPEFLYVGWRRSATDLYLGTVDQNLYYPNNNATKLNTQTNITIQGSGSYMTIE